MGVYIDMEMPTSCPCELLGIGYDLYCSFTGGIPARVKEYYECCQNGTRPSWCPLVPVPPHGRLIDADALKAKQQEDADLFINAVSFAEKSRRDEALNAVANIINAPTIIPAEPFSNLSKPCKDDENIPICTKASPSSLGIYEKAEEGD